MSAKELVFTNTTQGLSYATPVLPKPKSPLWSYKTTKYPTHLPSSKGKSEISP